MKKFLLVFSFFILVSTNLSAQGGFNIGVKGGMAFTNISNLSMPDSLFAIPSFSPYVGLSFGYNEKFFNFGYTVGIFYKQYKQQYWASSTGADGRVSVIVNYLEIPLLMRFRNSGNKMSKTYSLGGPYFEVGLQPGLSIGSSISSSDKLADLYTFDEAAEITTSFAEGFGLSAIIGVGFHQIGTRRMQVTHGLRLGYQFLDASKTLDSGQSMISIGYLLNIAVRFGDV